MQDKKMSELIKSQQSGLISLLHSNSGGLPIPKPFEKEIFLFDTHVAGTSFVEGIIDLAPSLHIGDRLNFFREPDNPYDDKAIVIRTQVGVKIGYIPRANNLIFARLMDAGKLLFGIITNKELKTNWLKIEIKVDLQD